MNNEHNNKNLSSLLNKEASTTGTTTINDLREREFNGKALSATEKLALANFDKFRISELNKQPDDISFHKRYRELQVMSNLGNYEEFLNEKYSKL